METVDKIIFNDKEYNKLYKGSDLLFEVKKEAELDYLTFTALEPSTILYNPSRVATAQYSYDKINWKTADNVTLKLNTDDKVYFKGNITSFQTTTGSVAHFTMTGKIAASGSIMSLQEGNPQDKSLKYKYEFYELFLRCSSLVTAPELPANSLTESCYSYMFAGCTSIVNAPALPSTSLAVNCYDCMFGNCTSLINAPALPANTLELGCYINMFSGCTSLEKAPDLPAVTLAPVCYYLMFEDCINLNYVKCNVKEYNSHNFDSWLKNVSKVGDFYCYDASIFPKGTSGIPEGWTVHSEI